jgi:hypothetical protein
MCAARPSDLAAASVGTRQPVATRRSRRYRQRERSRRHARARALCHSAPQRVGVHTRSVEACVPIGEACVPIDEARRSTRAKKRAAGEVLPATKQTPWRVCSRRPHEMLRARRNGARTRPTHRPTTSTRRGRPKPPWTLTSPPSPGCASSTRPARSDALRCCCG